MRLSHNSLLSITLAAISAVMVIASGWLWLTRWTNPAETASARSLPVPLSVDWEQLDAGEVWEQSEFIWTFHAHNRTAGAVLIHAVSASCECTGVEPQQFEVPPGGVQMVTATIDLTQEAWDAGVETLPFSVVLEPRMGAGPIVPMEWNIHGTVRRNPISAASSHIDLDDRSAVADARAGREVFIEVLEEAPATTLTAETIPSDVGQALLQQVEPRRYLLVTAPAPQLGPGRFEYRVVITANGDFQLQAAPSRTITVTGTIPRDVSAQPRMLTFGARPPGTTESEVVLISSLSGRAFTVESVEVTGAGTSAVPITEGDFGKNVAPFEIRQEYRGTGHGRGSVRFDVRYSDGDREVAESVVVRVTYYALANAEMNGGGDR